MRTPSVSPKGYRRPIIVIVAKGDSPRNTVPAFAANATYNAKANAQAGRLNLLA